MKNIILIGSEDSKKSFYQFFSASLQLKFDDTDCFKLIQKESGESINIYRQIDDENTLCVVQCMSDRTYTQMLLLPQTQYQLKFSKKTYYYIFTEHDHIKTQQNFQIILNHIFMLIKDQHASAALRDKEKLFDIENKEWEDIVDKFLSETNSLTDNYICHHPVIQNFGHGLNQQSRVKPNSQQIKYMLDVVRNFAKQPTISSMRDEDWQGYAQYFPKSLHPQANRSFLVFTSKRHINQICLLIKSNTKINRHSNTSDTLWSAGSSKQIKLYALLMIFPLNGSSIDKPTIKRIVTFSKPATEVLASFPDKTFLGNPNSSRDLRSRSEHQRIKSDCMYKLLTSQNFGYQFFNWHSIMFMDQTLPGRKILSYQENVGSNLDSPVPEINKWDSMQRIYAILSLCVDLHSIISKEHIIPRDIKFPNLCYQKSDVRDEFFNLRMIDYLNKGGSTHTFLRTPERIDYSHPVILIKALKFEYYVNVCLAFEQRTMPIESISVKLILYHMCFELILLFYWIFNINPRITNSDCLFLFAHTSPFIQRNQLERIISRFDHDPTTTIFASTLLDYTYDQDFTEANDQIIRSFFTKIRNEITRAGHGYLVLSSHDENAVLSDLWIQNLIRIIQNLPNTPKKSSTSPIEILSSF